MRRIYLVVFSISIVALVCTGYLFVRDISRGFPELADGAYVGALSFKGISEQVAFVVVKPASSSDLVVVVSDESFSAQRAPVFDSSAGRRSPLIISGIDARLKLSGVKNSAGRYEGDVIDPIRNLEGSWFLQSSELPVIAEGQGTDLKAWLLAAHELASVEGSIDTLKRKHDLQKVEMERLNRYLIDDGALKERASSRLTSTSSALDQARSELAQVRAELNSLTNAVEISQRVSPQGRLAILSRESLQRESRWIEITLRLLAPETAPGFEEQLERAARVKDLQDQIAAEHRRIEEIESMDRYRGVGAETPAEEEFYRELQ